MKWQLALVLGLSGLASWATAQAPMQPAAKPIELVLEDQFSRRQELATYKGEVVVMVYGDRRATDACRDFGEKLHVLFHPTAAGQTPAKARTAPVAPLAGVPMGQRSPDVVVIPVATVGDVPGVVKDLIKSQIKKASPDVPVWMDFTGAMTKQFTLRESEPNIVVFDHAARLRLKINGHPDKAGMEKLLQTIQNLRAEAAGLKK
jgi:hypothetical protein